MKQNRQWRETFDLIATAVVNKTGPMELLCTAQPCVRRRKCQTDQWHSSVWSCLGQQHCWQTMGSIPIQFQSPQEINTVNFNEFNELTDWNVNGIDPNPVVFLLYRVTTEPEREVESSLFYLRSWVLFHSYFRAASVDCLSSVAGRDSSIAVYYSHQALCLPSALNNWCRFEIQTDTVACCVGFASFLFMT